MGTPSRIREFGKAKGATELSDDSEPGLAKRQAEG
jgi:hypothetical protein